MVEASEYETSDYIKIISGILQLIVGLWSVTQWFVVQHDNFSYLNSTEVNLPLTFTDHHPNGTFINCTLQKDGRWMSWGNTSVKPIDLGKIDAEVHLCKPPMDVFNELTAFNLVALSGIIVLISTMGTWLSSYFAERAGKDSAVEYAKELMEYLFPVRLQLSLVTFVSTVVLLESSIDDMSYKCGTELCPSWMFYTLTAISGASCLAIFFDLSYAAASGNGYSALAGGGKKKYSNAVPLTAMLAVLVTVVALAFAGKFNVHKVVPESSTCTSMGSNDACATVLNPTLATCLPLRDSTCTTKAGGTNDACAGKEIVQSCDAAGAGKAEADKCVFVENGKGNPANDCVFKNVTESKPMLSFWILVGMIVAKFVVFVVSIVQKTQCFWIWNTDATQQQDRWCFLVYKILDALAIIALLVAAGVDISREGHAYAPLIVLATLLITCASYVTTEHDNFNSLGLSITTMIYVLPTLLSGAIIVASLVDDKFEYSTYNTTEFAKLGNLEKVNSHEFVEIVPLFQMFILLFASWKFLASLLSILTKKDNQGQHQGELPYSRFSSSALAVVSTALVYENVTVASVVVMVCSLVLRLSDAYIASTHEQKSYLYYPVESEAKAIYKATIDNVRMYLVLVPIVLSFTLLCVVLGTDSNDNKMHGFVIVAFIFVLVHLFVVIAAILNDNENLPNQLQFSKSPAVRFVVTSAVLCFLAVAIQKQGFDRWTIGKENDYTEKYLIQAFFLYGIADAAGFLFI